MIFIKIAKKNLVRQCVNMVVFMKFSKEVFMRFKVKQLMITVMPERIRDIKIPGRGVNTHEPSDPTGCHGISLPPCHNTKPWSSSWRDKVVNPADLATLHEQLIVQLDKVEEKQRGFEDKMSPQSIAEIDLLEKHLREALDDLKIKRARIQQKSPK